MQLSLLMIYRREIHRIIIIIVRIAGEREKGGSGGEGEIVSRKTKSLSVLC